MRKKVRRLPATTNNLTIAIIQRFLNDGHFACRINNGAVYDPVRQIFRKKSPKDPAIADIHATLNPSGLSVWIEVKNAYTNDVPTAKQIDFAKTIRKCGGLHFFAPNFRDFCTWYDNNVVSERDITKLFKNLPGPNCTG